jgi:hypothetical protein
MFVTDRDDTICSNKKVPGFKKGAKTMRCNNTNNTSKTNRIVLYTVIGTLAVPLVAAAFIPAIYLPLLGLTIPFLAAAFAESRVEALGCAA